MGTGTSSNNWLYHNSATTTTVDWNGFAAVNGFAVRVLSKIKESPLIDDDKSMSFRIHVKETDEPGFLDVYVADSLVDTIETECSVEEMTEHFRLDKLLVRYYDEDHEDTDTELDIIATINSLVARLQGHIGFNA